MRKTGDAPRSRARGASERRTRDRTSADDAQIILRHWRDAVPDDRLAHLVKDATRALVRALQIRLARHDVSFGHWTFLRVLWESDGLTQRALSLEAGVMEPTTHVALAAMERLGYIERRKLADNRRNVHVFLTAHGRALKRTLVPLAEDVNRVAIERVSAADFAATRATLLAVIANLARDAANQEGVPPPPVAPARRRRAQA